jgi:hypothetical protein
MITKVRFHLAKVIEYVIWCWNLVANSLASFEVPYGSHGIVLLWR